jgi:hypothetical protein
MRALQKIILRMSRANFFKNFSLEYIYYILRRAVPLLIAYMCKIPGFGKTGVVNKPIFLLGMQGGGLTIISRILRRTRNVVSISGGSNYWSGADEMNSVLSSSQSNEYTSIEHFKNLPSEIVVGTDWICGTNKYVKRFQAESADKKAMIHFNKVVYTIGNLFGGKNFRFIDKSQNYSLKTKLLIKTFQPSKPIFIFLTRDPYAQCFKVASGEYFTNRYLLRNLDFNQRLSLACESWANYILKFEEDTKGYESAMIMRIEDIVLDLEKSIKKICEYCDIVFEKNILPTSYDKVPFGSRRKERWFPVLEDINAKYYDKIDTNSIELIDSMIGDLAKKYGYKAPKSNYK